MDNLINYFLSIFSTKIGLATILTVLGNVFILSAYEFFVYRFASHKALYSKSFSISIALLPFFIGTIIMALQSNYYLTLGTIGALAMIRYRTAIKDPVDIVYLLWSIHTGIMCGCQLYQISYVTSLVVTAIIILMEKYASPKNQYILTLHLKDFDDELITKITKLAKRAEIQNRTKTASGYEVIVEFNVKNLHAFEEELSKLPIKEYSIIECSNGDIFW